MIGRLFSQIPSVLKNLPGFAMKNLAGFGLKNLAGFAIQRRQPGDPLAKLLRGRNNPRRNRDRGERQRQLARLRKRLRKLTRNFGMNHPLTIQTHAQCRWLELRLLGD